MTKEQKISKDRYGEVINTFLLSDPDTVIPMNRKEFYEEQIKVFKKTGKPSRACEIVVLFIFNRVGEVIIQKRSFDKNHNPGLLDKSIGGHIRYGDTEDFSVMVETVQELQIPSFVLKNEVDFKKTLSLLCSYLSTISIVKHSKSKIFNLERIINNETIIIANKVHIYFGIYDGRIRPVDREAKGILYYSLDELEQEVKKFPDTFTNDVMVFLKEFKPEMKKFLKTISRYNN